MMNLLRHRDRGADPLWKVASATQIFGADEETVNTLARVGSWAESPGPVDGVLIGRRHPTGWFLHGVRRHTLMADELPVFTELVMVRSYLLLAHGPDASVWRLGADTDEWRSPVYSMAHELAALESLGESGHRPSA
jgi:hypothetical protein